MKRAYKYRFYPTDEQAQQLLRTFGCVRLVWNKALEQRHRRYALGGGSTSYSEASQQLTEWKRDPALDFLNEVSSVPLQQVLRHQQGAFASFFAKRTRYPRFKSRRRSRASAEYSRSAFRWRESTCELTLAKMTEPLAIRFSRPLPAGSEPSTVTVSRDFAGRWFVSLLVETQVEALPQVQQRVGLDAGLSALLTLSTGEKVANPRHGRGEARRLRVAQQSLARKQPGSANREKARLRVARIHARVADRRSDALHKLSTRLVRENQTIVIEDLAVRNMLGNHTLARSISDAGWSRLRELLEYKCQWYGRDLVAVDRWYPSTRTCSGCGALHERLPLSVRSWTCTVCGEIHDRDVNAAKNILAAGLAER